MMITKYIILTLAVSIAMVKAKPEYRRVVGHIGEDLTAYEDVMIDKEANLLIATVAKISSRRVTPSIAFHDFAAGYSAIKLVEKGVCYIEKKSHDLEYLMEILDQAERNNGDYDMNQTFKCTSKTIVKPSELFKYGERISAFCKEYESFYVEKEYKMRSKRDTVALGAPCVFLCFNCNGFCRV